MDIAGNYGLPVLEDATEAMGSFMKGGRYDGRHAGTIGDIGVFSFNANKIITTGGGGMMISFGGTDSNALARAKKYLDKARYLTTTAKDDGLYFAHNDVGYNYRMLNLQAALGVSQIDELEKFVGVKKRNYELYCELLKDASGITVLPPPTGQRWNHWFYSIYVDDDDSVSGARRDRLMKAMIDEGIQCRPVWKLVHTQEPYRIFRAMEIIKAYDFEKHIINLPCSSNLPEEDVRYVCDVLNTK
jgi:dTDP-4-amino-4,6-dideoxygalactose transaminase